MAKIKADKIELADKSEKVVLEKKSVVFDKTAKYKFISNGKSPYMQKGEFEVTGEQAEIFTKQGYGEVFNDK